MQIVKAYPFEGDSTSATPTTLVFLYLSQVCRTKVIELSEGISQHAWYPCTISYSYSQLTQPTFWLRVSQSVQSLSVLRGPGSMASRDPSSRGFVYPWRVFIVRTGDKTLSGGMLPEMESLNCL